MAREARSFERKSRGFKPQPTVLVVCEDLKSSKIYLEDAARYFRVDVKVDVVHCGKTDPGNIVKYAVSNKRKYDEIYCVIDRDSHESFDEAILFAKKEGIETVKSYPCFEFWLLLHFSYCAKPYRSTDKLSAGDFLVVDLRKNEKLKKYQKGGGGSVFGLLLDEFPDARLRSPKVYAQAVATKNMNPSTEIHLIIDRFERLSVPH